MNLGEFRELTGDLPNDWPVIYVLQVGGGFSAHNADASVNLTEHRVEVVYEGSTALLSNRNTED